MTGVHLRRSTGQHRDVRAIGLGAVVGRWYYLEAIARTGRCEGREVEAEFSSGHTAAQQLSGIWGI